MLVLIFLSFVSGAKLIKKSEKSVLFVDNHIKMDSSSFFPYPLLPIFGLMSIFRVRTKKLLFQKKIPLLRKEKVERL